MTKPNYDLSHAVDAHVFANGSLTFRETERIVWAPGQRLLEELLATNPVQLTCFHDYVDALPTASTDPESLEFVDAYLIDHKDRVIFLGQVLSGPAAWRKWHLRLELGDADEDEVPLQKLRQSGPFQIVRDCYGCTIGVDMPAITDSVVEMGVRKYFRAFCSGLADLPIRWLPGEEVPALTDHMQDLIDVDDMRFPKDFFGEAAAKIARERSEL